MGALLNTLFQDVRFGLRVLAKNPGFTAVAVLTLTMGMGGTTAIFSLLYGAVLHPFSCRADSARLVVLVRRDMTQSQEAQEAAGWAWVSPQEFLGYREQNEVFDEVVGGGFDSVTLTGADVPQLLFSWRVTDNAFRVFGAAPLMGRPITAEDCKPGAPAVAVLGHKAWQNKFGGDPGIVGRIVILNHQPTTIVGVMPPRFAFGGAELWLPATLLRGQSGDQPWRLCVIGHLKPGVAMKQVQADMAVLTKRLAAVYPNDHPQGVTFEAELLVHSVVKYFQSTYYILMAAVGLLLLIACVNIANLLLARATGREKEFAIRAASGASRGWLVRQLLIESSLLALGGGILGCLLAWNGLGVLVAIVPPWMMASEAVIHINGTVLLFTLGAAVVCTLLFGLAPALLAVSRDLQEPLKASGRGAGEGRGHHRLRNLLVVGEVALSLVLLTGAGLLMRSFFVLRHAELGYNADNVLGGYAYLPDHYRTAGQKNRFHIESLRRLRAIPGVVSACLFFPPPTVPGFDTTIDIAGKPRAQNRHVFLRLSSDGLSEAMGIRLLQGRGMSEADLLQARPVVVVSRAFVKGYLSGDNPLGQTLKLKPGASRFSIPQVPFEIIGVAADTKDSDSDGAPRVYVPYTVPGTPAYTLFVRTVGDPARLTKPVLQAVADVDKEVPVDTYTLREDMASTMYDAPRFVMMTLAAFAALGLVLVSVGVYSVLSYAISRRTQEIGIRMALGAQATDVRRMVMMAGLRWLVIGIGIGIPASIALAKVLQNRIWGINSADPLTLVGVSLVLTAVGLAACYFPTRRATKVDPMVALRYE